MSRVFGVQYQKMVMTHDDTAKGDSGAGGESGEPFQNCTVYQLEPVRTPTGPV